MSACLYENITYSPFYLHASTALNVVTCYNLCLAHPISVLKYIGTVGGLMLRSAGMMT